MPAVPKHAAMLALLAALGAGCAASMPPRPDAMPALPSLGVDPALIGPAAVAAPPAAAASIPDVPATRGADAPAPDEPPAVDIAAKLTPARTTPVAAATPPQPAIVASTGKPVPRAPALAQPARNAAQIPAVVAVIVDPPLDVPALKARLRQTDAIGMFAKMSLETEMDDLIGQFRDYYRSGRKTGVAWLRQPYDTLVYKVVAMLQKGDPALAHTITRSREAIWGVLADPDKFAAVK